MTLIKELNDWIDEEIKKSVGLLGTDFTDPIFLAVKSKLKELAKKDLEKIDVGSQLIYPIDCINIFNFKKDLEEVVKDV